MTQHDVVATHGRPVCQHYGALCHPDGSCLNNLAELEQVVQRDTGPLLPTGHYSSSQRGHFMVRSILRLDERHVEASVLIASPVAVHE